MNACWGFNADAGRQSLKLWFVDSMYVWNYTQNLVNRFNTAAE